MKIKKTEKVQTERKSQKAKKLTMENDGWQK